VTDEHGTGVTDTADADGTGVTDEHRTPVSISTARATDPHMQDAALHPRRVEGFVAVFFIIGIFAVCAFGGAYWAGATTKWLAGSLAIGLFCLGFGLTAWGKYLMPRGPFVEERHDLHSSPSAREAMAAALVERTGTVVKRRKMLGGLLATGMGIFGVVAVFPLLRSLGVKPGSTLYKTTWKKGSYLVDFQGKRITRTNLLPGGYTTVFPEGTVTTDDKLAANQTILIRVQSSTFVTVKGRTDWSPEGYVAYSQVCTHLGCPVRLYEQELELLVCPCHQSMFQVRDGAVPKFGPAPRPLPQLPIRIDSNGFLRARGGFNQPIGPGFWERTTEGNGPGSATPAPGTKKNGAT
jgi:ubiquinol-cytochrome c reductase iron-sulfur subunit